MTEALWELWWKNPQPPYTRGDKDITNCRLICTKSEFSKNKLFFKLCVCECSLCDVGKQVHRKNVPDNPEIGAMEKRLGLASQRSYAFIVCGCSTIICPGEKMASQSGHFVADTAEPSVRGKSQKQSIVGVGGVRCDALHPGQETLMTNNTDRGLLSSSFAVLTALCRDFQSKALQAPKHPGMQLVSTFSMVPLWKVIRKGWWREALLIWRRKCRCCCAFFCHGVKRPG